MFSPLSNCQTLSKLAAPLYIPTSSEWGSSQPCQHLLLYLYNCPGLEVKASAWNEGDQGSIPESGRSPGERKGNPFQYSCLENPTDRGAWWVTVHGWQRVRHNWATNMNSKLRSYGIKNWTDRQDRNSQGLEGGLRRLLFTPQAAESHRGLLSNYLIDLHSLSTVTEAKGKSVV